MCPKMHFAWLKLALWSQIAYFTAMNLWHFRRQSTFNVSQTWLQWDKYCAHVHGKIKYILTFQKDWFVKFAWLHFDSCTGGVLCHVCATAAKQKILGFARCQLKFFPPQLRHQKSAPTELRLLQATLFHNNRVASVDAVQHRATRQALIQCDEKVLPNILRLLKIVANPASDNMWGWTKFLGLAPPEYVSL